ncbi:DsbA family protein [Nocardioides caeni]|uniref:Disulfide bond formation protein DsbA n=1 Tax=Nocardioides caeni TaxID=574700 RepID=A0A4S8NS06_9ACTN|nr:thioredoxin domain-containing protein [Nocardioides caeni]THV18144.1 disulfide bond formation protein DsbA [Nocardioides caeni]
MSSSSSKAAARAQKAAEMRAVQEKREARRRILTILGVVVAMIAIVGGAILIGKIQTDKEQDELEAGIPAIGKSDYGLVIGEEDAPHSVIIYEDFLCPYCGQLEAATRDNLAELAAEGKVRVEYRPFDLLSQMIETDYPIRAANAFAVVRDTAGDEAAKEFHDLLFERQPTEGDEDSYLTDDELVALAVEAGATEADVRGGIEGLDQEGWVDGATAEARESGVSGTPTVFVDGEVFQTGGGVDGLARGIIGAVD